MERGVEQTVETYPRMTARSLEIRLLGPVRVRRDGKDQTFPRSRKVRALLAFLVQSPASVSRSRLCDLLWDGPNDPRGELRWCLSKIRSVLGDGDGRVVASATDTVTLDLSGCFVDVTEIDEAVQSGIDECTLERLDALSRLFGGEFLEGLELDDTPGFSGWLSAQRHRYRTVHIAIVEALAKRSPPASSETFVHLQTWLQLAPLDPRAHSVLLQTLLRCGRMRDAEEHVIATIRAFEQEGVDWSPLRDEWRTMREAAGRSPALSVPASSIIFDVSAELAPVREPPRRRASVAIMPFVDRTATALADARMGDGLTDDVITRLAKLRVLFVIARGSVYALSERHVGPQEAGRILNVDYVVSGSVRRDGKRVSVRVELAETRDERIVWSDDLDCSSDDALHISGHVVDRIVASVAEEIELAECQRAVLKAPHSLDAWEAYHRGLWHMYKFNAQDNRDAAAFFRTALDLDPTFSRAYAGLSFTHFQNAFLELTEDREGQIEQAFAAASRSLGADDRDPAAHWAMGRALWLRGAQDESIAELQCSIDLSPNFALGHYTLGFVHSQTGDPQLAIEATSYSSQLSPFDPLQFAMLASRALAHVRLGEFEQAAHWAVKATARPNAHRHILAIATECLALVNRRDDARRYVERIRSRIPAYNVESFLRAFHFEPETQKLFRRAAEQISFG